MKTFETPPPLNSGKDNALKYLPSKYKSTTWSLEVPTFEVQKVDNVVDILESFLSIQNYSKQKIEDLRDFTAFEWRQSRLICSTHIGVNRQRLS
jgi:hypothetical protein